MPRVGILVTGSPPEDVGPHSPSYPHMLRTALGDDYVYSVFDVRQEQPPRSVRSHDAYVITGSLSSVYDELPWIERLRSWIARLDPEVGLIGICFGHQIMAQAYGGVVRHAGKGWAGGLREFQVVWKAPWMDGASRITLPVDHQDQVVEPPPAARLVATSAYCPYAVLSYPDRRAISFQAHFESDTRYAAALIERNQRHGLVGAPAAQRMRSSLERSNDCPRVAGWVRRFIAESAQSHGEAR